MWEDDYNKQGGRWLIANQQIRLVDEGSSDRHPLLLATRELTGEQMQAIFQTDRRENFLGRGERLTAGDPGDNQRDGRVFDGG